MYTNLGKSIGLALDVDDLRGHAGVDDDRTTLILSVDPELGGGTSSVENTEDVGSINVVKVLAVEISRGLHN